MEESTRGALVNAGKRYFEMASRGDSEALRQNAISGVASDFGGIETAVRENQTNFAGTQAVPRPPFLLKVEGTAPLERGEFLCGIFGPHGQTADSAVFLLNNLPPGSYGVVTLDVPTPKGPYTLSFVLQQAGADWKLGGFYVKTTQAAGHDGTWFADRAREFKAKGQLRNAWLYFLQARDLLAPLPFMSTLSTDKLYDEMQAVKPLDLPIADPVTLAAGGRSYQLTAVFPLGVGSELDLVVKYRSPDVSNSGQTYQDNIAVIKALVAKYPEFRDAFGAVVARAVEPSGRDYGSLLNMKDIK
jgi:hypothetical protein